MAHTLKVRNLGTYLHLIVEGDNTAEDVSSYLSEGLKKCIELGCPNVLIEENLVGPSLSILAVYEIVTKICWQAASVVKKVAFVDVNPESKKEVNKFAETMALNRGINIRLFETVGEAECWLRGTIPLGQGGLIQKDQPERRERA